MGYPIYNYAKSRRNDEVASVNKDHQPELYPPGTFQQDQQNQLTAGASIQAAMGAFDKFLDAISASGSHAVKPRSTVVATIAVIKCFIFPYPFG